MKNFKDWNYRKERLEKRSYIPPEVKVGDVYWFSFGLNIGKEIDGKNQNYTRPGMIYKITTKTSYLVIPLTTSEYYYDDWHLEIFNHKNEKTLLCFNQIRVVDFKRMKNLLFSLKQNDLSKAIDHFNKLFILSTATDVAGDKDLRLDASALAPKDIITNGDNKSSPFVYLDHAGATPISDFVLGKMRKIENSELGLYANPSGIYKQGVYAKRKLDEARKVISGILNTHSDEIIFTGSGTESNNLAVLGYVKSYIINKKNIINKVVTTNVEHSAILEPLRHLEKMGLIEIIYLKVDETGKVKVNDLREILNMEKDRIENATRSEDKINNIILVSVMYANNETGRVQPVKEIGRMIDLYNKGAAEGRAGATSAQEIIFHIDACQAPNYLDIDTKKLRAHMMSVNSSKIYGPKGVAILFKKRDIKIEPVMYGGGQESGLRSGTENIVGAIGFAYALQECENVKNLSIQNSEILKEKNYLSQNSESEIERLIEIERLTNLQNYFFENIKKEIPEVKIYTYQNDINKIIDKKNEDKKYLNMKKEKINFFNIESLPNNINIGLPGMLSDEMVIRLDAKGYAVSHKSACASNEVGEGSHVLIAMGANVKESNENIRISMGRGTTERNIKDIIKDIKDIYFKYNK